MTKKSVKEVAVKTYVTIESAVVGGYKAIESAVVDGYKAVENNDVFVVVSESVDGVVGTPDELEDALTQLGVERIPALGETFDPNRHNAVMHVDDSTAEENTIVEVFQQGFLCGDKVIRFAMVKVAN